MADFSWLRLGQRPHLSSSPRSSTSPESRPSQVPSQPNLGGCPPSSPEPSTGSSNSSLLVRDQDRIWYNPSLNQMVEALQVVIMTQGLLRPIPVECNSYIIHLIEGFAGAQERIRNIDAARAEAKNSLEHHLENFKSVADEWLERESQYKTEIKRLEVLLSRTSRDGLEAVALARTTSIVDRNGPQAKQFASQLKRLSTHDTQGSPETPMYSPNKADECRPTTMAMILDKDNDFLMSEKMRRHQATANIDTARRTDRRPRHKMAVPPRPRKDASNTKEEAGRPKASTNDMGLQSRPLFSDDMSNVVGMDDNAKTVQGTSILDGGRAGRQILADLLDGEAAHNGSEDASPRLRHAYRHAGSCEANREPAITSGHDPHLRHLRGLSGFSFVPGDDASSIFACGRADDESMMSTTTEDDNGNENVANQAANDDQATSPAAFSNLWSPAKANDHPQSSSTSSVDTMIRTAKETAVATG